MTRITRAGFNKFFTIVSILAGLISLGLGLANSFDLLGSFPEASGPMWCSFGSVPADFFLGWLGCVLTRTQYRPQARFCEAYS